jgi:hypothetical protein
MRRIAIVGSLVAMLVFAAVALGAVRHYHGKDTDPACTSGLTPPSCAITFDGGVRNHKVVRVKNFAFDEIPMQCDEGAYAISNTGVPLPTMRVNAQRRFHGEFVDSKTSPTQYTHVAGRFSTNYKRATGHFRFHGDFRPSTLYPTGLHNCDTNTDTWHARSG